MTADSRDLDVEATLAATRSLIAREMLAYGTAPISVGDVTLHPHQREAVVRLRSLLRDSGGALLADSTGSGKTFVALAIAREFERVLIVAPAALAEPWQMAATRAAVAAPFVSLERLSRGARAPIDNPELLIVDEAHHLRNPRTKRYATIASLCEGARVLLLSATPLQNRRDELVAQLALFLGDAAVAATDAELARYIVRRRIEDGALRLPTLRGPQWITLPIADDLLDDLLELPPPIAGADEGTAGALVTCTLLRQWSSSRAALVAALRRRIARALAMISSLEAGVWPTRQQLAAWSYADQSVQLAFPELLAPFGNDRNDQPRMLEAVRAHLEGLRRLVNRLRTIADPDPLRAAAVIDLCRQHAGRRVIAFSQYADTVAGISRLLMQRHAGVAALSAGGGRVAGGRISRREVLAQFAPRLDSLRISAAEEITMLVTTDVLSEGLDLQRASVVVHLDLPWNPARLEQRVGRARRLGSEHETVFVYALAPPLGSERMLRVVERLQKKLGLAGRIVGLESAAIPEWSAQGAIAPPELASEVHALLESWRSGGASGTDVSAPLCAAASAPNDGLVALLTFGSDRLLIAALDDDAPSSDAAVVSRALAMCLGPATTPEPGDLAAAKETVRRWCSHCAARSRLVLSSAAGSRLRARVAARITSILSAASRHEQAALAPLASRAQSALRLPLGIAAERKLCTLEGAERHDVEWVRAIAALADGRLAASAAAEGEMTALILLRRARRAADVQLLSEAASR